MKRRRADADKDGSESLDYRPARKRHCRAVIYCVSSHF
jgi:hypothetical protein